ncbi:MAG: UDP-N-acetylmuramoyl-L-alanyl-D-glutamate--2,6-diaminopimelate ligase [Cardiobacteriaceae bacterium]|nr:UDP-N-acetylmuramoyl-L-alanyl-D-glutamate--2,6-diaminopimelate ligase [Cardiobacteriaceae bacterium]
MNQPMTLSSLLAGIIDIPPSADALITGIQSHSGQLQAGDLWLAMRGVQGKHGLDYQPTHRPAAILYESPYENPPESAIAVPNLSALASQIAGRFYGEPSKALCVVGVTGTDGKSSLVHLLSQALDGAMIGTIGYGKLDNLKPASHTTPEALVVQKLLSEFQAQGISQVAMEVSSHALCQHRVADVDMSIGVFTNLSRDHLDYHKDMEEYFLAKALLFQKPLRAAVVNIDDAYGQRLIAEKRLHPQSALVTVSSEGKEAIDESSIHLSASHIEFLPEGLRFDLAITRDGKTENCTIQSALLARFNVHNLMNVAAVLSSLGVGLHDIQSILGRLKPVRGRAQKLALKDGSSAVIDYAHTPAALENILQGIRPHVRGKLYVVFGCGGDRDKGKRPLMAEAAKRFADVVVMTDDNPRTENPEAILQDMQVGAPDATIIRPRASALAWVYQQLQAGDVVVVAGKGHEDYQIIGKEKHHYSDVEMIEALEKPFAKALSASEVAQIVGGYVVGDSQVSIQAFTTDSRQAKEGMAFIALRGERFDGADFVEQVYQAGAAAALVHEAQSALSLPQIVVEDTKQALWSLARFYRAKAKDKRFVALTGSNGKTSTKEMLAKILSANQETLATRGNLNNDLGVPLTLLNLNDTQHFAVIEMGANHQCEIAPLAELVRPDVALITNVSAAHIEGFGGLSGVLAAKTELFEYSTGTIVLNQNSLGYDEWAKRFEKRPQIHVSSSPTVSSDEGRMADVRVEALNAEGSHFALFFGTKRFEVRWQLLGKHNLANAAAACACGLALGLSPEMMTEALQQLRLEQSRLTPYVLGQHQLFDDTYNANPASFYAAFEVLSALREQGFKPIVFAGAMAELGEESEALHEAVASYAKDVGVAAFHYVRHARVSTEGYARGFPDAIMHTDHASAQSALQDYLAGSEPVVILVKGSRSAAMELVLSSLNIK